LFGGINSTIPATYGVGKRVDIGITAAGKYAICDPKDIPDILCLREKRQVVLKIREYSFEKNEFSRTVGSPHMDDNKHFTI
jgi:hypothetical protein